MEKYSKYSGSSLFFCLNMKYELHLAIINSFKPNSDSNLYLKPYFFTPPFRPAVKVWAN
jgi:hypothetical protein